MQGIRTSFLGYLRVRASIKQDCLPAEYGNASNLICRQICADSSTSYDDIMHKVIGLVKKYDRIDSTKVTETADFQKDLSLDSLDRVELVMAFEQEFSIEIPDEKADKLSCCDEKADKLSCCADVAKCILSRVKQDNVES